MAPADLNTYLAAPYNPFRDLYDTELRDRSEQECYGLAAEASLNRWDRNDWITQRQRRCQKDPSNEDIRKYGLVREVIEVPRTPSVKELRDDELGDQDTVSQSIKIVILHGEKLSSSIGSLPCIFYIHGGCRIGGTPYSGNYLQRSAEWARNFNALAVSVEYRLSPYTQGSGNPSSKATSPPFSRDGGPTGEAPTIDCFDALKWVYKQLGQGSASTVLKYGDPGRLIVLGSSAGGGFAASVMMKWYQTTDVGRLCGLVLEAPQLCDRCNTPSQQQFDRGNMFTSKDSILGWSCSLGSRRGGDDVTMLEAPARATANDVKMFPPTYIDVGAVDPLKDEVVRFAGLLSKAGVEDVDLRVFRGCFHGFFQAAPDAIVSKLCNALKMRWLARRLGVHDKSIEDECAALQSIYDQKDEKEKGYDGSDKQALP